MRPVAIFRHFRTEGPGYFAIFLERHGIPWRLIAIDDGAAVPTDPAEFSGFCFMGGPMSVNDPLPWIADVCQLIRKAAEQNIPVIGHCLGGQLMSKALGGQITRNPVKEIGWGLAQPVAGPLAEHWFGPLAATTATIFHWHGETFSLPPGAERLLGSAECANQMFALGPHLGMQCHVEMTPEMISRWCRSWDEEVAGLSELPPSVQSAETMQAEIPQRLPAMRTLADQLYSVWIKNLKA
ncbi:MAG TPA: type 1 glutamine amidotransferase [Rhodocyclaceae bacterium]|nr:type 1 glutamine amidotransferase [Rhodocyclaceae bacterium]